MSFLLVGAAAVTVGTGVAKAISGSKDKKKAMAEAKKAQAEMDAQKDAFSKLDTSNPYANMENTMEDLTVNTQQAEFEAQQNQQNQANILSSMKGAAGGSGIGSLAQILANQGALQTQKASASIAQQEQANQKAAASADLRIQQLQGAGDAMVQQAQSSRQATILGMNQSVMAGVNANYQRQQLNQQYANAQANKLAISSLSQLATLDLENLGGTNSVGKNVPDLDMDGIPDFIDAPQPSTIGPKLPQ